jgi:hypothetical protein
VKVKYVKFYQPVQIGIHQETTLGTKVTKNKNVEMSYENGLMKIVAEGVPEEIYVPFSNIMMFSVPREIKKSKVA